MAFPLSVSSSHLSELFRAFCNVRFTKSSNPSVFCLTAILQMVIGYGGPSQVLLLYCKRDFLNSGFPISDGLFDSQAVIGSRLDRLWQRLQRAVEGMIDGDGTDTAPPRPSSLSLVDSCRPASAGANHTSIPTAATGINSLGSVDSCREGSSSPSSSVHQRVPDVAVAAASTGVFFESFPNY